MAMPSAIVSLMPTLRKLSSIPGMLRGAPPRTDSRRGLVASPRRRPARRSRRATWSRMRATTGGGMPSEPASPSGCRASSVVRAKPLGTRKPRCTRRASMKPLLPREMMPPRGSSPAPKATIDESRSQCVAAGTGGWASRCSLRAPSTRPTSTSSRCSPRLSAIRSRRNVSEILSVAHSPSAGGGVRTPRSIIRPTMRRVGSS